MMMRQFTWTVLTMATLVMAGNAVQVPDDFRVHGLADIEPAFASFQGRMYAGLLPFHRPQDDKEGKGGGEFMFWYFQPDVVQVENTLSIYLSGGPGCSSIGTGNFFGTGPVTVPKFPAGAVEYEDEHGTLQPNAYAWTQVTPFLYIEQPATTGFSHGPLPHTEADVARDMYAYLRNWLDVFTELQSYNVFLWGGSYSGMNVPALARKIYYENKKAENANHIIHLSGIALGNAWVDPKSQGPAAVDFAWSHGLIDLHTRNTFHQYWDECMAGRAVPDPMHSFTTPDDCGLASIVLQAAGVDLFEDQAINAYDVTTWDKYAVLEDNGPINKFYNNPAVQKALHTPPIDWHGCVESGHMLNNDKPESVVPYVAELLDNSDIRVLFWNGDRDLLCCHTGTDALLQNMQWSNTTVWSTAPRGVWVVNDRPAGYTKALGQLQFVTVYNSGHMVYHNQPARALNLVSRFIKGETLLDKPLPSYEPPSVPVRRNSATKVVYRHSSSWPIALAILAGMVLIAFVIGRHQKLSSKQKEYEQLMTMSEHSSGASAYGSA